MEHVIGPEHLHHDVWLRLQGLVVVAAVEVGVGRPLLVEEVLNILPLRNKSRIEAKIEQFILFRKIFALKYLGNLVGIPCEPVLGTRALDPLLFFS